MADRPPFDPSRASFTLIAAIIGVHCVVVLAGAGLCVWQVTSGAAADCDSRGRLGDLLAGALAAALAFSGGRKPPDPPTKGSPQ
jgi:hypothetical protein